jgi:prolyl oligopeptidase
VAQVLFSPDSGYMVARTTDTTSPEGKLFAAPLAALSAPAIDWQRIAGPEDKITDVALRGNELVVRTYQGAPRGKLLAIPLDNQALAGRAPWCPNPPPACWRASSWRRTRC